LDSPLPTNVAYYPPGRHKLRPSLPDGYRPYYIATREGALFFQRRNLVCKPSRPLLCRGCDHRRVWFDLRYLSGLTTRPCWFGGGPLLPNARHVIHLAADQKLLRRWWIRRKISDAPTPPARTALQNDLIIYPKNGVPDKNSRLRLILVPQIGAKGKAASDPHAAGRRGSRTDPRRRLATKKH